MIERNRNDRLTFIGKPELGESYPAEGKDYKFMGLNADGRGKFDRDGVIIYLFIAEKGNE